MLRMVAQIPVTLFLHRGARPMLVLISKPYCFPFYCQQISTEHANKAGTVVALMLRCIAFQPPAVETKTKTYRQWSQNAPQGT